MKGYWITYEENGKREKTFFEKIIQSCKWKRRKQEITIIHLMFRNAYPDRKIIKIEKGVYNKNKLNNNE